MKNAPYFSGVSAGFDDDRVGSEDGPDAGVAQAGLYLLQRGGVALSGKGDAGGHGKERAHVVAHENPPSQILPAGGIFPR